jgi:polysaccharide biosynthesis/export protein
MKGRREVLTGLALLLLLGGAEPAVAQSAADGVGSARSAELVLRPGDMLRITVWPNNDVGGEFVVEETGFVYLPLLEAVRVGGVPLDRVRQELRGRYGEAMRNPVVTITAVYPVSITGEVQRPGIQMITPTSTLFDVIDMAGGFRPQADPEKLRVVRPGEVIEVDALRALETGQGMDAIQLRSGDHIVVPRESPSIFNFSRAITALQTVSLIVWSVQRMTR